MLLRWNLEIISFSRPENGTRFVITSPPWTKGLWWNEAQRQSRLSITAISTNIMLHWEAKRLNERDRSWSHCVAVDASTSQTARCCLAEVNVYWKHSLLSQSLVAKSEMRCLALEDTSDYEDSSGKVHKSSENRWILEKDFASSTSCHGIHFWCDSRYLLQKIFWILLVLGECFWLLKILSSFGFEHFIINKHSNIVGKRSCVSKCL